MKRSRGRGYWPSIISWRGRQPLARRPPISCRPTASCWTAGSCLRITPPGCCSRQMRGGRSFPPTSRPFRLQDLDHARWRSDVADAKAILLALAMRAQILAQRDCVVVFLLARAEQQRVATFRRQLLAQCGDAAGVGVEFGEVASAEFVPLRRVVVEPLADRKSTRLNSSH